MRKRMKNIKPKSFTVKLIISSILILTVLLTLLSFTMLTVFRNSFNEEIERYTLDRLEFVKETVDTNYFSVVQKACITILGEDLNDSLNSLLNMDAKKNYTTVKRAYEQLQLQKLKILDFSESVNMYYSFSDMIISTETGVSFLKDRARDTWVCDREWIEQMKVRNGNKNMWAGLRPVKDQTYLSDAKNVFTYVYTTFKNRQDFLYVNIDERTIRTALDETMLSDDGCLMLVDSDGRILSHSDADMIYSSVAQEKWFESVVMADCFVDSFEMDGEKKVVSSIKSGCLDMYYVYLVNTEEYYRSSMLVADIVRHISYVFLIIAGAIAALWAYANALPVSRMAGRIRKKTDRYGKTVCDKTDMELIEGVFIEMDEKLTYLSDLMNRNRSVIKNTVFSNLLAGNQNINRNLHTLLEFSGIVFDKKLVCTLTVQIASEIAASTDAVNAVFTYVSEFVSKNGLMKTAVVMDEKNICIIVNADEETAVVKASGELAELLENSIYAAEVSVPIHIGIGSFYPEPGRVSDSCKDAACVLEYAALFPEQTVFCSWEYEQRKDEIPDQVIDMIIKALYKKTVEEDGIIELKKYLYESGSVKAYLRSKELIIDAIGKMLSRNRVEVKTQTSIIENLECAESLDEFLNGLTVFMQNYDRTEFTNIRYVKEAKAYVEEHLDKMVSAEEIAGILNINSSYFSRIFKNSTGECYTEYVTRIRMEMAEKLLKETALSVRQIACRVGFGDNYSYFGRKFKSRNGITPGEYRKKFHT